MAAMNQDELSKSGDGTNKRLVAVAAAISVVLLVSFSNRPPWRDPPKPRAAGYWRRLMRVQRREGGLDVVHSDVAHRTDALAQTAGGR